MLFTSFHLHFGSFWLVPKSSARRTSVAPLGTPPALAPGALAAPDPLGTQAKRGAAPCRPVDPKSHVLSIFFEMS